MRAASYPGSTDDNVAVADHPLFDYKERVHINHGEDLHLLGETLTLRSTMMTPISDTRPDTPEQYSQGLHLTARNVVECSGEGLLKARFRCLLVDRKQHYTSVTTYCDIQLPEVEEMLAPEPPPGYLCHQKRGWLPANTDEICRDHMFRYVKDTLFNSSSTDLKFEGSGSGSASNSDNDAAASGSDGGGSDGGGGTDYGSDGGGGMSDIGGFGSDGGGGMSDLGGYGSD